VLCSVALRGAFEAVNEMVCRRFESGCVAVVALVMADHAVIANAGMCLTHQVSAAWLMRRPLPGDSRAIVVGRDGAVKRLTRDHKASDPVEARALTERGTPSFYPPPP
jgi:hypothetical protein